ncbi:unnamed protein product [Miscanthus lutarioriparius]|uniref:Uncharacterized protein n=1 Tax=Miscanthus lutarioriparius TaxID=422564 RepID=A0A811Q863_9POAL|nr:unnamed protein product [Miscanthus lutarioriparius]
MEKRLVETDLFGEMGRWSKPSIYRVPEWVKNMTTDSEQAAYYRPLLVSLGPFHHGKGHLADMEKHKERAVLHIVKRSGKPLSEFITAIEGVIDELLDAYDNLEDKWRKAERHLFVKIMVLDGCFLLEMLKVVSDKEAPRDYATNDPVFSVHGMLCLWVGIRCDMLVIENQIPLLALYKLEEIWRGTALLVVEGSVEPHKKPLAHEGTPIYDGDTKEKTS